MFHYFLVNQLSNDQCEINEEFHAFALPLLFDLTGSPLANIILTVLRQLGLDFEDMVGLSYDDAYSMSGIRHRPQAIVRQQFAASEATALLAAISRHEFEVKL